MNRTEQGLTKSPTMSGYLRQKAEEVWANRPSEKTVAKLLAFMALGLVSGVGVGIYKANGSGDLDENCQTPPAPAFAQDPFLDHAHRFLCFFNDSSAKELPDPSPQKDHTPTNGGGEVAVTGDGGPKFDI